MRAGSSPFGNSPLIIARQNLAMPLDPLARTADAALAARDALNRAAAAARDERGAGRFASAALFEEALLGALRARIAELRSVVK